MVVEAEPEGQCVPGQSPGTREKKTQTFYSGVLFGSPGIS